MKLKAAASARLKRIAASPRLSTAFSALKEAVSNVDNDTSEGGNEAEVQSKEERKDRSRSALNGVIDAARDLVDDADLRMALVLSIADSLKQKGKDSAFLHPMIFRILEPEVQAANFLVHENLI